MRDARRRAPQLRSQLPGTPPVTRCSAHTDPDAPPALTAHGIVVRYGPLIAVRGDAWQTSWPGWVWLMMPAA
jgi:energy-coupling factor transport system ATP-binding protein